MKRPLAARVECHFHSSHLLAAAKLGRLVLGQFSTRVFFNAAVRELYEVLLRSVHML